MEENENISWLYGLNRFGIVLGLKNIKELLHRLKDPQKNFKSIHVAGTDGKGSTSAMIASILRCSGIKTGLFTSPHIIKFNERISISGEEISDEDLNHCIGKVKKHVEAMRKDGLQCTAFEVMTAIAFLYFMEKKVEYAVVEVGMGGRFDATNVLKPEVSVITRVSLEHTEILGETIKEIAFEKAGIIKKKVPVITNNTDDALKVITDIAVENSSDICIIDPPEVKELTESTTIMRYSHTDYIVGIPGDYQAENACLAIEAVRSLPCSKKVEDHIQTGLESVKWPCRLQKIEGKPLILDVTHTSYGSKIVYDNVKRIYNTVVVVFGVLSDKNIDDIAHNLSAIASKVIITIPPSERAMGTSRMVSVMRQHIHDVEEIDDFNKAMERAMSVCGSENVLVTGSFYMAEGGLRWLGKTSV